MITRKSLEGERGEATQTKNLRVTAKTKLTKILNREKVLSGEATQTKNLRVTAKTKLTKILNREKSIRGPVIFSRKAESDVLNRNLASQIKQTFDSVIKSGRLSAILHVSWTYLAVSVLYFCLTPFQIKNKVEEPRNRNYLLDIADVTRNGKHF
ncbi:hypothetical protein QE152_g24387 [Popillia japonica]|uniref:Uncharacterized protein n=1 Tax=Popillia japonica TaxID=7064 RepID=A0AAW1KBT4_POPJA